MVSKSKLFQSLFFSLIFLILALSVFGQQAEQSKETAKKDFIESRHKSPVMKREMPYRVILPVNYDKNKNERFAAIYLLHGRFGHYNDWTDKAKISEYAKQHNFIIVMPEGGDQGWYTNSVSKPEDKYESYFFEDLIPEIDKKFRTLSDREHRAIAGLSMGGYGAFKYGLKHPEKFVLAGSFSGALDAPLRMKDNPNLSQSIIDAFGEDDNPARKTNDLYGFINNASGELPFLYFVCGTSDHLFQANRNFVAFLTEKKVPHEYRQMPGAHTWEFWDTEVQEFLRIADRMILKKKK
ncbi:alpha/beta hydrolase family protein [soil metagenome]